MTQAQTGCITWQCGCTQNPKAPVDEFTYHCERHADAETDDYVPAPRPSTVVVTAGEAQARTALAEAVVALHVALRHADGTLADVPADVRALELAGCQDVLDRLATP